MIKLNIPKPNTAGYLIHPKGYYTFRVVDYTQPMEELTPWGPQERFRFVLESELLIPDRNKRYEIRSTKFTLSLHEKANLRAFVQDVLGRELTDNDLETPDDTVSGIVGKFVKVMVSHSEDGKWANIKGIDAVEDKDTPIVWESNYVPLSERRTLFGSDAEASMAKDVEEGKVMILSQENSDEIKAKIKKIMAGKEVRTPFCDAKDRLLETLQERTEGMKHKD